MLKMSRGLYTGGNFKQTTWKKSKGKLGTLFATYYRFGANLFVLEYIMRSLLARLPPLHSENVD